MDSLLVSHFHAKMFAQQIEQVTGTYIYPLAGCNFYFASLTSAYIEKVLPQGVFNGLRDYILSLMLGYCVLKLSFKMFVQKTFLDERLLFY